MKWHPNDNVARRGELLEPSSPQFYTRNARGQYELFPKEKTSAFRFLLPILGIGLVILLLFTSTGDAEEVKTSTGLLCDTLEQVETVLNADDQQAAMTVINAGHEIHPCIIASVAYLVTAKSKTIVNKDGVIDIYEVLIVGFSFDGTTFMDAGPLIQYVPVRAVQPAGLQI